MGMEKNGDIRNPSHAVHMCVGPIVPVDFVFRSGKSLFLPDWATFSVRLKNILLVGGTFLKGGVQGARPGRSLNHMKQANQEPTNPALRGGILQ